MTEASPRSVVRPGKVAMITYAHAEPMHTGQMDLAEQGLASAGYAAGQSFSIKRWFGNRDRDLTLRNAHEVVAWGPDVVLSFMTNADLAMLEVTRGGELPIVCWSMDPVGGGLIVNPDRPEGSLTGVTLREPLQKAQLDVLLEMRPGCRRVAALHNPTYAIAPAALARLTDIGRERGIEVVAYECFAADQIRSAFAAMASDGFNAAIIGPHEVFNGNGALISDASAAEGIAVVGLQSVTDGGGPAGFSVDFASVWSRAAQIAAMILEGNAVADIPFARVIDPWLILNRAGFERLGLELTPTLEAMAHHVQTDQTMRGPAR